MKQIVEEYKREVQAYLNDENEPPVEIALPSVRTDLQEALVLQRRRLKWCGLKLIIRESSLKDSKQEGEYLKEYIENTRKYLFKNGENSSLSGRVQKKYCINKDSDAKRKVMLVEVKDKSFKPYIKKVQEFWQYYFGDIEHVKASLSNFWFAFIGFALTIMLAFLSTVAHLYFYGNGSWGSFAAFFWPIPCMWVIWTIYFIIQGKPRIKKKSPRTALLSIQSRKSDFSPSQFMAMASSRLKCLYYAESREDIGSFTDPDLNIYLNHQKNVVNCELAGFAFDDFVVTKDYMQMCVEMKVILDCNVQRHIEQQEETVKVRFVKARDSIMSEDFYHDWYVTDAWNE